MRPDDPDTIIRTPYLSPRQRLRNLLILVVCVAAAVALVGAVRNRLAGPSTDTPGEPVPLPPTGPALIRSTTAPSGFVHPGVLVTVDQLEVVRKKLIDGVQPWAGAFQALRRSEFASLDWQPEPRETVECGPYSNPNRGCSDQWHDAVAAYSHALLWYLTGDRAHAAKSVEIIDSWSAVLRRHTNSNAPLQAGWSAATLVRAAELMRYTYDGWTDDALARAETMFRDVFLPLVGDGGAPTRGGNWDLIILDAAMGIAVFLDDRPLFERVVERWRTRLPAYIYLSADGPVPVAMPGSARSPEALADFWYGQSTYIDGLTQETCRDLGHTGWGLEAMAQIAETAWIQGLDLYAEAQDRLVTSLELHAGFSLGDDVPRSLCGGRLTSRFEPIPEIAYHHYHNRLGIEMPRTQQMLESRRPQPARFFFAWGTLTTADDRP